MSDSKSDCDLSFFKNHCICKIVVLEFRIVLNLFGETFHAFHNPNDIAPDHKMCEFRMTRDLYDRCGLIDLLGQAFESAFSDERFELRSESAGGGVLSVPMEHTRFESFLIESQLFPGSFVAKS